MITWSEYNRQVNSAVSTESAWRVGQAYYNVLRDTRPDLAGVVQGTEDDPFYDDRRIPKFLVRVRAAW